MRQVVLALGLLLGGQPSAPVPPALEEMANAERAFVQRAQEVAVIQAFTEYFADDAVGFASGAPESAQEKMKKRPFPPRDPNVLFWWEPRTGDVAASGDLGWLTGPVRMGRKDDAKIRHGNYASIWKRQPDGKLKVVIDIGIDPPGEVPFAPGFTRASFENRYQGSQIPPLAQASLLAADRALNAAARSSMADAYVQSAASAARLHRNGHLPFEGRDRIIAFLKTQPAFTSAESLYAEAAKSADLGYTWGSYETAAGSGGQARSGHYARVWVRQADGVWRVVLDLDAPKPEKRQP
jgi:ketosteroid isomerase-like protein